MLRAVAYYSVLKNLDVDRWISRVFRNMAVDIAAMPGTKDRSQLSGYISWLKRWEHNFNHHFNFDVPDNPSMSMSNFATMQAYGLSPIPIYHMGEPWKFLNFYSRNSEIVSLGSIRGKMQLKKLSIAQAMKQMNGNNLIHLMGVGDIDLLRIFPFYSASTGNWLNGVKYGNVRLFDVKSKKMRHMRGSPCLAQEYGTRHNKTLSNAEICKLGAMSINKMETWLRSVHGNVGNDGPKIYLTDTSTGTNYKNAALYITEFDYNI